MLQQIKIISEWPFYLYLLFGVLCLIGSCCIIYLVHSDPNPCRESSIYFITSFNFLNYKEWAKILDFFELPLFRAVLIVTHLIVIAFSILHVYAFIEENGED